MFPICLQHLTRCRILLVFQVTIHVSKLGLMCRQSGGKDIIEQTLKARRCNGRQSTRVTNSFEGNKGLKVARSLQERADVSPNP